MLGFIYKIIVNTSNEIYIGSTFQELRHRWQQHKDNYKRWKEGKSGYVSVFKLFEKHGFDNCKLIIIKEYEVYDRKHLEMYETLWISNLKLCCINKYLPFNIRKLYHREYDRQYRQEKKEHIQQYQKKYRQENKEQQKHYFEHYYQENKEKFKEQLFCNCGEKYTYSHKKRHEKSIKHQKWLETQQNNQ